MSDMPVRRVFAKKKKPDLPVLSEESVLAVPTEPKPQFQKLNKTFIAAMVTPVFANGHTSCFQDQYFLKDEPVSPWLAKAIRRNDAFATLKAAGVYNVAGLSKKDVWVFFQKNSDGRVCSTEVPRTIKGKYINRLNALQMALDTMHANSQSEEPSPVANISEFLLYPDEVVEE